MKGFKRFFSQYSKGFWIFVTAVIILTAATCSVNNSLLFARNDLNETAHANAAKIAHFITLAESAVDLRENTYSGRELEPFADELRQFIERAYPDAGQIIADVKVEPVDTGLSYSLDERPFWYRSYNEETRRNYFTLSEPVVQNGVQTARNLFYFDEQVFLRYFFPELKQNESVTLLAPGNQILLGDISILTEETEDSQLAFVNIEGGFTFIQSRVFTPETAVAAGQIILFGASLIFCAFLIQPNKNFGASPFGLLVSNAEKATAVLRTEEEKPQFAASLLLFMSLIVSTVILILFNFLLGSLPYIFVIYLVVLLFTILAFVLKLRGLLSRKLVKLMTYAIMTVPFAFSLLHGGADASVVTPVYIWTFFSLAYALYCRIDKSSNAVFKIFSVLIFPEMIIYALIVGSLNSAIMHFAFNTFLFAFVLFASFESYVNAFIKSYGKLRREYNAVEEEIERLQATKRMAELGRLLEVEIQKVEVPALAAKKAAASLKDLGTEMAARLITKAKDFNEEDLFVFRELMKLCLLSLEKINEHKDIEMGAKALAECLAVQIKNHQEVVALLMSVNLYDIEKIEENLDIFKKDNIAEILQTLDIIYPALSAIAEVGAATAKVMERGVSFAEKGQVNSL